MFRQIQTPVEMALEAQIEEVVELGKWDGKKERGNSYGSAHIRCTSLKRETL